MVSELKAYLLNNGYPLAVCYSEDATRISGGVEYKYSGDQLTGLVAPLNENGMPTRDLFGCTSPSKVISDIQNHPIGRNVELAMARPILHNAAPFCILYYCTDNKFSSADVSKKWDYIQAEMNRQGIKIVCKATDGDTRFIRTMLKQMDLPSEQKNPFGEWFVSNTNMDQICIQDPTHLANKFRTRLMKADQQLILGMNVIQCIN